MDKYMHYDDVWDEITYPIPNFNGAAVEVWEWISNFIPHFTGHLITYPCWDLLVKGPQTIKLQLLPSLQPTEPRYCFHDEYALLGCEHDVFLLWEEELPYSNPWVAYLTSV